jgi:parallel beta-helix repeat protein
MEKVKIICGLVVTGMFLWIGSALGQVSVDCSAQSLQTAINNNGANTTFNVSGTCNENITISETREKVTINGVGTAPAIVGAEGTNTVTIRGQGVTVTGFTISGGLDGIQVVRGGTATIDGNTIQNTGRHGITVSLSSYATITNNTITGNPSTNPSGSGIIVSENSTARIGFSSTSETVASPNIIQNHGGPGIAVERSATARIVGNTISSNNGSGIVVTRGSTAGTSNNIINSNGGSGIYAGYDSLVNLGNLTGSTIYDLPNSTTSAAVNNAFSGLACSMGATVTGRLGTLNGNAGPFNNVDTGITTSELETQEGINIVGNILGDVGITGSINAMGRITLGRGFSPTPLSSVSRIEISSDTFTEFFVTSHNTTGNPSLVLYKSRGNIAAPAMVADGDFTGSFFARGFDGSAYKNVGGVRFAVDGTPAAGSVPGRVTFHTTAPGAGSFTERMRITASGNVGIGTTTPAYLLDVNGQARINGIVYPSSRALKDNIVDLKSSEALDALKGLNPVRYKYKADQNEERIGFIAEDVPDLVAKNGRIGIDPMDIVAVLTKVVQEQQSLIKGLEQRLLTLEGK